MKNPIKMAIRAGKEKRFKKLLDLGERQLAAIPAEDDGTRVLAKENIGNVKGTIDDFYFDFPIEATSEAKKLKLVYRLKVPYYSRIPEDEIEEFYNSRDPEETVEMLYRPLDRSFYHVPSSVMERILEIVMLCEDPEKSTEQTTEGYSENLGQYIIDDKTYDEDQLVFMPLVKYFENGKPDTSRTATMINFETFPDKYTGFDVSGLTKIRFEIEKPLFPNEKVWVAMKNRSRLYDTVGYMISCHKKRLMVPVVGIYNPNTGEKEYLPVIFNAKQCVPTHHGCCWDFLVDIGNLNFTTSVRYFSGEILDWEKIVGNEIECRRKTKPNFDPFNDEIDDEPDGPIVLL